MRKYERRHLDGKIGVQRESKGYLRGAGGEEACKMMEKGKKWGSKNDLGILHKIRSKKKKSNEYFKDVLLWDCGINFIQIPNKYSLNLFILQ